MFGGGDALAGWFLQVDYGEVWLNDTLFFNNTCMSSGAALYTTYSNVTILGTNFLNNTANSGASVKTYQSNVRTTPHSILSWPAFGWLATP